MATALVTHPSFLLHEMGPGHPECPARLTAIAERLVATGVDGQLEHYVAPRATREAVLRAHDARYVDSLEAAASSEST